MEPNKTEPTEAASDSTAPTPETKETGKKRSLRGLDANFELLKSTIAGVLSEGGNPTPRELTEITEKLGCSQPTARKWMKLLESSQLVRTEELVKGRGRPKIMYHPTPELLNSLGAVGPVAASAPPEKPGPPPEEPALETPAITGTAPESTEIKAEAPAPVEPKASFWKSLRPHPPAETPMTTTPETKPLEEKIEPAPKIEEEPAEKDELLAELAQLMPTPESAHTPPAAEKAKTPEAQPPPEAPVEPAQYEPLKPTGAAPKQAPEKEAPMEPLFESAFGSDDELLAALAKPAPAPKPAPGSIPSEKAEPSAEIIPPPEVQSAEVQPPSEAQPEQTQDEATRSISETVDTVLDDLGEKLSLTERIGAPKEFSEYCTFELPSGYQELERYWITKPLVWVAILYSPDRNERMYQLVEPSLTPGEKTALQMLHAHLLDRLVYDPRIKDRDRVIQTKMNQLLREYGIALPSKSIKKLLYYLKRNYMGYGKLDGLFRDPNIEDISCDGLNVPIFIYSRRYQSLMTNIIFTDTNELDLYTIRLVERAGKQISLGKPSVDASLPEGYRLQATLGTEVTTRGSSFSIRKYAEEPFTPVDVLSYGTFSVEMLAYLWLGTENKKNVIIVGGTASGKTSTLNALSMFIWPDAKIVSIEDTRELALYQANWVPSVVKLGAGDRSIDMYELLRTALRQRPEVIIVGEVRGKEALTMFQAMSTGHTCYSTMHAGSIQEMVHRLEGEPINVPHHMLSAMDIVCLQLLTYYRDQRVRRNQSVVEIAGIDPSTGSLRTNRIFERNPLTDEFERVGESNVLREIAKERGWSAIELERELRRRQEVLGFLLKNNIKRMHEVAAVFRQYYFEPEKVMEQLAAGKLKI